MSRHTKTIRLTEYTSNRGTALRVDREAGVIRGVKVLGLESKNGRTYVREAIARAAGLYEGAKVNVNHPRSNAPASRDYQDRLGVLKGVHAGPEGGLYADLHFNPKHTLAEQLLWDAEHSPENVGLSHNVEARTSMRGKHVLVEEIKSVVSVDLVADPATTNSLFEGANMDPAMMGADAGSPAGGAEDAGGVKQMFLDGAAKIFDGDGDPASKAKQISTLAKTLLKVAGDIEAAISGAEKPADTTATDTPAGGADKPMEAVEKELKTLRERVDAYAVREAAQLKREAVDKLVAEAKLPAELVTEVFTESLLAADEAGQKRLIEDRQLIAKATAGTRPVSKEQRLAEHAAAGGKSDRASFLEAIRA